jgi:hypothetical protein
MKHPRGTQEEPRGAQEEPRGTQDEPAFREGSENEEMEPWRPGGSKLSFVNKKLIRK